MKPSLLLTPAALALSLFAAALRADEILFKSGDRLTGTVKSAAGGSMVFESKVAGTLTVKMEDILTFSTDKPVDLELDSGKKVGQVAVARGADGQVASAADPSVIFPLKAIAKINPPSVKWDGKAAAGASVIRGNTHSESVSLSFDTARRTERDRISFNGAYSFARERDISARKDNTTLDTWFLKGQYDYYFTGKNYLFGNLKYEKDRIAGLNKRVSPAAGCGYQWIESPGLNFRTELGASWLYERYDEPDETRTYLAGRLAYHFDKSLNSRLKLYHNLEYIPSFERADTFLANADAGLQASLTARWALDFKAVLAYNSQPSDDRDKLDTRYITSLAWTF